MPLDEYQTYDVVVGVLVPMVEPLRDDTVSDKLVKRLVHVVLYILTQRIDLSLFSNESPTDVLELFLLLRARHVERMLPADSELLQAWQRLLDKVNLPLPSAQALSDADSAEQVEGAQPQQGVRSRSYSRAKATPPASPGGSDWVGGDSDREMEEDEEEVVDATAADTRASRASQSDARMLEDDDMGDVEKEERGAAGDDSDGGTATDTEEAAAPARAAAPDDAADSDSSDASVTWAVRRRRSLQRVASSESEDEDEDGDDGDESDVCNSQPNQPIIIDSDSDEEQPQQPQQPHPRKYIVLSDSDSDSEDGDDEAGAQDADDVQVQDLKPERVRELSEAADSDGADQSEDDLPGVLRAASKVDESPDVADISAAKRQALEDSNDDDDNDVLFMSEDEKEASPLLAHASTATSTLETERKARWEEQSRQAQATVARERAAARARATAGPVEPGLSAGNDLHLFDDDEVSSKPFESAPPVAPKTKVSRGGEGSRTLKYADFSRVSPMEITHPPFSARSKLRRFRARNMSARRRPTIPHKRGARHSVYRHPTPVPATLPKTQMRW